jgi:putative transposase
MWTTLRHAELVATRRHITELETELAVTRGAMELLKEAMRPKCGARPSHGRCARAADLIGQIHAACNGINGGRRVHAELPLGRGITVGHGAVELLMRRAGITGLPGNRRRRPVHQTPTAADLVERHFARGGPDQLWVTDIT